MRKLPPITNAEEMIMTKKTYCGKCAKASNGKCAQLGDILKALKPVNGTKQ